MCMNTCKKKIMYFCNIQQPVNFNGIQNYDYLSCAKNGILKNMEKYHHMIKNISEWGIL